MRSITSGFLLLALTSACEHKSKKAEPAQTNPPGSAATTPPGSANPGNSLDKPEPVVKADPDAVRPPVATDLAEYIKDIPGEGTLIANIETSLGTLHCELYGDKVPITVANFVGLATGKKPWLNPKTRKVEKGVPFFDGVLFHRVIPEFMLQAGDPLGQGIGGPGYNFDDEIVPDYKMDPGTLAMANAGVRNGQGTNGSQFFIMEGSRPDLVGRHAIFGKCKELDLVKQIARVPKQCPTCSPDDPAAAAPNPPFAMTKVTITKGKL